MNRAKFLTLVLALTVSGNLLARGNLKDLTITLKFTPQEGVHATSPDLPVAALKQAMSVRVEDLRSADDRKTIGQGTGGDDKRFPIYADADVIAFVRDAVGTMNKSWSVQESESAPRVLVLQVVRYAIDESNKAVGSVYAGEVKLGWMMRDARGKTMAEGSVPGTAHRYGRAHSAENINEVMSDALKEAYANVLDDKDLQAAWTSGATATRAAPAAKESPEERLKKLDELLKKGLITKPEYDRKRAEILKEL